MRAQKDDVVALVVTVAHLKMGPGPKLQGLEEDTQSKTSESAA